MAVGNVVLNNGDLAGAIAELPPYSEITLRYRRNGETLHVSTRLIRTSTRTHGRATPDLGVEVWTSAPNGVQIKCVAPGSTGSDAGLQAGDILHRIEGVPVTFDSFEDVLRTREIGESVALDLSREGVPRTLQVKLAAPTAAVAEQIEVGSIEVMDERIERVIDVETVSIENCHGSAHRTSTQTITKEVERNFSLHIEGELQVYAVVPLALAEGRIASELDFEANDRLSLTRQETLGAAPGTIAVYDVRWYELSTTGVVSIRANEKETIVPFTVARSLRAQIESRPARSCS
jgi:hypothetical protein